MKKKSGIKERINGYLTSDLKLVTNSKKLTTNGYLKIVNGELISDKIVISLI